MHGFWDITPNIDHKGPYWNFMTLKITFKMHSTPFKCEDIIRTSLKATWCNKIEQNFCITEQSQRYFSKLIGHIWLPICVSNKLWSTEGKRKSHMWLIIGIPYKLAHDAPFIRYNHLKVLLPWFDILRFKCHKVTWKIMYDFYMCYI